jgi:hypothetical protein
MFSFYFIMKSDKQRRGFLYSKPGWKVERGVRFALKIWTVGVPTVSTNIYGYREKAKDQNRKIEITRYRTKQPTTSLVAQAKDRYGIENLKEKIAIYGYRTSINTIFFRPLVAKCTVCTHDNEISNREIV